MWDVSSPTRDQTHILCIVRLILNHWATKYFRLVGLMRLVPESVRRVFGEEGRESCKYPDFRQMVNILSLGRWRSRCQVPEVDGVCMEQADQGGYRGGAWGDWWSVRTGTRQGHTQGPLGHVKIFVLLPAWENIFLTRFLAKQNKSPVFVSRQDFKKVLKASPFLFQADFVYLKWCFFGNTSWLMKS